MDTDNNLAFIYTAFSLSISLSFALRQIQCEKQINFVRLYRSCWCVFLCTSAAIMTWCYISSHSFSLFAAQATKLIELPKSQSRNTSLSTLWLGNSFGIFVRWEREWVDQEIERKKARRSETKELSGLRLRVEETELIRPIIFTTKCHLNVHQI